MGYSTNDIINKLKQEDDIDISARTINYYAYDKKMFPDLQKGKNCFSDREVELIKRIVYLKNRTSLSLDEIKDCIQDDYKYLLTTSEIVNTTLTEAATRGVPSNFAQTFSTASSCNFCNSSETITCSNSLSSDTAYADNLDNSQLYKSNFDLGNNLYSGAISTSSCSSASTPQASLKHSVLKSENINNKSQQTVKINSNITITVSDKITREQLIDIINYINSKTN